MQNGGPELIRVQPYGGGGSEVIQLYVYNIVISYTGLITEVFIFTRGILILPAKKAEIYMGTLWTHNGML